MARNRLGDLALTNGIKAANATASVMDVVNEILARDDEAAIASIRSGTNAGAMDTIQNNERIRQWFRSVLQQGDTDPFA